VLRGKRGGVGREDCHSNVLSLLLLVACTESVCYVAQLLARRDSDKQKEGLALFLSKIQVDSSFIF